MAIDRPTVNGPLTAEELEDRDAGWDRQFKLSGVVMDELDRVARHVGVDFGSGDSWTMMEWTRDAQGNLQVRNISQAELLGGRVEDCGNQYTGGQDF